MSNKIQITPFSLKQFGFDPHDKSFAAEASMLGIRPGVSPYSRLYTDAMDVGIAIESHVTHKVELFHLVEEKRNSDGDLAYWIFEPVNKALVTRMSKVFIFND